MKAALRILWQLPQVILGLIVALVFRAKRDGDLWICSAKIGVSFGPIIVIYSKADETTIAHERGHSKQSLMLGPLYLVIVGLPSIIMAWLSAIIPALSQTYYKRWPESWADKLGGVQR